MNKTKRVLSVVLAVLMLSSLIAALAIADGQHTVVINYVFENGKQAAPSWTATLAEGSSLEQTVTSPTVVGYEPDQATVDVSVNNITENKTYAVTYYPANVGFTVNHYLQNVADNNYTLDKTEEVDGYTESEVGDGLAKAYPGFAALLYNTKAKVAADGSTVVEIYYDRNYYMMSFNLDGGYGVEPIYARYGTPVKVENPTKPGYTFNGWEPTVPTTVPAENTTYKAKWTTGESGFTVVFWYENANDDGYSYAGSIKPDNVAPGTQKSSGDYKDAAFTGRDDTHFTYNTAKVETVTVKGDGSTVLNVYFTRNIYSMRLWDSQGNKEVDVLTITAKYQQDISGYFPVEFDKYSAFTSGYYKNSNYPNNGYVCNWLVGYEGYSDIISRVAFDIMPGENTDYQVYNFIQNKYNCYYYLETLAGMSGDEEFEGKNFKLYRKIPVPKNTQLTYDEEFFEIVGFERWKSDPEFASVDSTPAVQKENKFYYTRNSYNLKFFNYNGFVTDEGLSVQYEAPLKDKNFTPDYPADLEANAYEFAGWYTTEGCFDGSEVDWDTAKMPAGDVVLYAKWAPKTHTVTTWLTADMKDVVNVGNSNVQKIAHGSLATKPTDPTNGNYTFVGWFYEENGVEKAFDFSMPIVKDLNLYAKWSSNTLVAYTIKYVLEKDGTTVIADETTGSALAGTTLTFEAKTGDELNKDYQSGYFPHTGSHSLTMDINGNNEFTFVYVAKEKVNYTVRYLEKGTEKVLYEEKTAETSNAIITEKFVQISGYAPDAYQKRLVLSANEAENVITFWYTKDELHAPVQIVHWTQNIAGEGYTEYQSSVDTNAEINKTQTSTALTITGFEYKRGTAVAGENTTEFTAPNAPSGTLTAEGLVLNLYYDRNTIAYTVKHVDANTNEVIESETGSALFGAQVIGSQKKFNGYMPADNEPKQKSIIIGTGTNEIIFYYYPCYYIGHVRSGSLDNTDTIRLTGSKANLTAAVTTGYLYGGAFDDEKCETVYNFGQENAINFTPVKGETYYIWEVSETYLKPRTYAIWRHDPNNNGRLNVVGLYLMTHADRLNYQFVGFEIVGENATFANKEVYEVVNAKKGDTLYQQIYVNLQGEMAVSNAEVAVTDRKDGYIAMHKLSEGQFATFVDKGLTFQPYWVTLDGIIVRGVNSRECRYKGPDNRDITVNNKDRIGSSVSNFATPSQQTVEAVSYYAFEAADVEVATPDVPETPEIPEVPEAPEMTLNSGAMYLRAQYTYEMMTNTVKFISAIDVNECTEYGFVINGEVVKCEEAAETVDGYDANYLFGGSVNGAMLMSCNMLLDGLVDGMTLNVTPYYVALDGTTVVYGETRTLVYRQWVGLEG
ncbi:MAG: InlB B-repeat-containing protein [Christensenellaceae bacterium]|nr:InlB B-repeat-containing protein [Christensenellaceae bacterium]